MYNNRVSSIIISVIFLIATAASLECHAEEANDTIRIGENSYVISSGEATLVGVNIANTVQNLPDQISYIVDGEEKTAKVTCIKKGLFKNSDLREIRLPQYLTTIEEFAFYNTRLTYIYFPKTITDIGSYAFAECKELRVTEFDPDMKMKHFYAKYTFLNCTSLQYLNLPNNLEATDGLVYVTEPDHRFDSTITSLVVYPIWEGCTSLKTIVTGKELKYFYLSAQSQDNLKMIFLNKKVEYLNNYSLQKPIECPALTDIYCIAPTPPSSFNSSMFQDDVFDRVTLHVPYFCGEFYLADKEWSKFKKIVEFGPSDLPDFSNADFLDDIKEDMPCHIANGWLRIDDEATDVVNVYSINGLNILTLNPGTEQQLPSGIYVLQYKATSRKIKI